MKLLLLKLTALAMVATSSVYALEQPSALRGSDAMVALQASSQCTDLGNTAAEHVVMDNWCTPGSTYGATKNPDYKKECKEVAYSICEGNIPNVANRWCPSKNMSTSTLRELQGKCERQVNNMVGGDSNRRPTNECVDDDSPRPVRDGQRFRFNLVESDAQCVDNRDRLYEWGQFDNCENFSECAELCVNDTPDNLAFNGSFRGFDYDCDTRLCRCLYDEGTLDSRNSGRFDRSNSNEPGEGSISGTTRKTSYYCGKLVGAEFLEDIVAEA